MNDSRVETVYAVEVTEYRDVSYGTGWEEESHPYTSFGIFYSREDAMAVVSKLQAEVEAAYRKYCLETEERNSRLLKEYVDKVSVYLSKVNVDDPVTAIRDAPYLPNRIHSPLPFDRWVKATGMLIYGVSKIPVKVYK